MIKITNQKQKKNYPVNSFSNMTACSLFCGKLTKTHPPLHSG